MSVIGDGFLGIGSRPPARPKRATPKKAKAKKAGAKRKRKAYIEYYHLHQMLRDQGRDVSIEATLGVKPQERNYEDVVLATPRLMKLLREKYNLVREFQEDGLIYLKALSRYPAEVRKLLRNEKTQPEFQCDIRSMIQDSDRVRFVAARLLGPAVRKHMILNRLEARHAQYSEQGSFQINVWAVPSGSQAQHDARVPGHLWSTRTEGHEHGFRAMEGPETGLFIRDRDGGFVVAEVRLNALFIHYDAIHYGSNNELFIFAKICAEAAKLLTGTTFAKKMADKEKNRKAAQAAAFEEFVRASIPKRQSRNKALLDDAEKKVTDTRAALFQAERNLFGLRESMSATDGDVAVRFKAEIEKLMNGGVNRITGLTFETREMSRHHVVTMTTDDIYIDHPSSGRRHFIGCYKLVFHLHNGSVQFLNVHQKTRHIGNGPHVGREGTPCLGNIHRELNQYVANFELEAAATLSIAYLESLNVNDAGAAENIRHYPYADQPH